jgi:hypothetical protein
VAVHSDKVGAGLKRMRCYPHIVGRDGVPCFRRVA